MKKQIAFLAAMLTAAFLQGCGGGAASVAESSTLSAPATDSTGGVGSSAPTITYTGFAIVQDGTDYGAKVVAFFSEDMDPSTINTSTVKVQDRGGKPVAGTVDFVGVTAVFSPKQRFNAETTYTATVTTGVRSAAGVAMAKERSWTFTTPDPSALTGVVVKVVSTSPSAYSVDVPVNSGVNATFGQVMDPATVNESTFQVLDPNGTPVAGTVHYTGVTASFVPVVPFTARTSYRAVMKSSVQSLSGVAMDSDQHWTFTTGATDSAAPQVVFATPLADDTGVDPRAPITIDFSESLDTRTVNTSNIQVVAADGTEVTGTVGYASLAATFSPDAPLQPQTRYTVHVLRGVTSAGGTAMQEQASWSFTTGDLLPLSAPVVVFTDPADMGYGASLYTRINVAFDQSVDPATVTADSITVKSGDGTAVAGTLSYLGPTVTFTPESPLQSSTIYIVTVGTGVKGMNGMPLAAAYSFSFMTIGVF